MQVHDFNLQLANGVTAEITVNTHTALYRFSIAGDLISRFRAPRRR